MTHITSIYGANMGASAELANRLQEIGIEPYHIKAADIVDPHLIIDSCDAMRGYTTNETSLQRLQAVRQDQRFRFCIEPDTDDTEGIGYRPQLLVDPRQPSNSGDIIGVYVNSKAIGRIVRPVVSIARACEIVDQDDPKDENYQKVLRVAISSTLALALSYTIFCEFGKFNTQTPCEPCVELEAIAEQSGITVDEDEPSGVGLREIGLRFAGGVAMRYMTNLAAQEFNTADPHILPEDASLMFGVILKSMALQDKATNEHASNQPVSYALEHAYSPGELHRVSNLWFRVSQ